MSRPIEFTSRAKQDLRIIADRSRDGAVRWLDALDSACEKIATDVASASSAPEADDLGIDLRQRLFKTRRGRPYRILYLIQSEKIVIIAIRGPGQDLMNQDIIDLSS